MFAALRRHWPEYLMEAAGLGLFMLSACLFTALLIYPGSPVHLPDSMFRRAFLGLAMGATNIALIYSPWGKQSGAHYNPAVTLTFLRLGKVAPWDAAFYIVAQFVGGTLGVLLAALSFRMVVAHPSVHYAVTVPGEEGAGVAFLAETVITFLLMTFILTVSNTPKLARFTGLFASTLVALYITFESPLSGMSMNPARTFSSAFAAGDWTALWVYFTAPLLGMLSAAELYWRVHGPKSVHCAKLHHQNDQPCLFCAYHKARAEAEAHARKSAA